MSTRIEVNGPFFEVEVHGICSAEPIPPSFSRLPAAFSELLNFVHNCLPRQDHDFFAKFSFGRSHAFWRSINKPAISYSTRLSPLWIILKKGHSGIGTFYFLN